LVFIYSGPVSTRARVTIEHHRYWQVLGDLPGRPDLVFPSRHAAIFVHGCFWHGHDCPMFRLPATRAEFWQTKIHGNRDRDQRADNALAAAGWRVLVVWECALRGPARLPKNIVLARCAGFLEDLKPAYHDIEGEWSPCEACRAG
jgi:DNA mismatch endonuclease (patch repair protein)